MDAIEISLAENFFRLAMNPAEACRAFEDIIASEGKSPADVAKRFGVTERFVLGRLRLAGLVEPVFDALANGEITLDVAMAYASTSDCERQAAVFSQLSGGYARGNSGEIRRQLAAYSYRATDPKALLVGREAYVDAGGRIDQDLFSDAESERWLDTHIVDRLAEERLAAAAEAIRAREGYGEVRIMSAAHVPYADTYSLEPIRGELPPLIAEAEARQTEIEEELSAIEAGAGDDDMDEETDARIEALECELTAIAQRTPIISDEQRSSAVAYVVIGQDGAPRIHEQLYVAPAEPGEDDDEHNGDEDDTDIIATGDGKPAISQRLADELAMMKTELLAVHVASDPGFALDLGTFFMVEAATRTMGGCGLPRNDGAALLHGLAVRRLAAPARLPAIDDSAKPLVYAVRDTVRPAAAPVGIYVPWRLARIDVDGANPHPDALAESVAMGSVAPPAPTYRPLLPDRTRRALSDAQLETVILAGEAFERYLSGRFRANDAGDRLVEDEAGALYRTGFIIGDGTGVGKGREAAGCIMDQWCRGRRKAVWISKSAALIEDARRDWSALGGLPIDIQGLDAFPLGSPIATPSGILFLTYATLRSQRHDDLSASADPCLARPRS